MYTAPTTWVLTGAIGTGKSTVGSLLAAQGARVIDADRIGHGVIDPSGPAYQAVAKRWPSVVVDNKIDRGALGALVFGDPQQLEELEAITHPMIVARLRELVDASNAAIAVVEVSVPHLPIDERWGRIVVVASEEVRRERLVRRGLSLEEIDQRVAAQPLPLEWVRPGDIVIDNESDLTALESVVDDLWNRIQRTS